jgi:cytochrome P450
MTSTSQISQSPGKMPPGPNLFDSLKFFLAMERKPLETFAHLHERYGDIVRLNLGLNSLFILRDADSIKYVLQKNIANYQKLKRLENGTKRLFGEGWTEKINREIIRPFFDPQSYRQMDAVIAACTQKTLEGWESHIHKQEPLDVAQEMMRLCLVFTGQLLISHDFEEGRNEVAQAMETIMDYLNARALSNFPLPENWPTPANRRYLAAVKTLQSAAANLIATRQQQAEEETPGDLISVLLAWRDEKTGRGLSQQLLRDRLLWILLPAFEPLGRALSWIWYLLATHPEVADKLQEELAQVLGERPPTFDDLPRLNYLKTLVQETLRLYPPFWVLGRESLAADHLGDFFLPAGSILLFNIYGVHHHPDYWQNPETFEPERFLPEYAERRNPAAFIPFSIGPRACLGYSLSMMQLQLVVAIIAQSYRLTLVPNQLVEPAALATLVPHSGLKMLVSRR